MAGLEQREGRLRAAIGRNADWYLARWQAMDATGRSVSWNWAAALLSLFWMAWRKMWLALAAFLLANVVVALIGAAVPLVGRYIHVPIAALSLVVGAWGNAAYRRKVERLVAGTDGLDEEAALAQLRREGGTSPLALGIALALAAAGVAVVVSQALEQARAEREAASRG